MASLCICRSLLNDSVLTSTVVGEERGVGFEWLRAELSEGALQQQVDETMLGRMKSASSDLLNGDGWREAGLLLGQRIA